MVLGYFVDWNKLTSDSVSSWEIPFTNVKFYQLYSDEILAITHCFNGITGARQNECC
jgi:hypothetical protein